MPGVSRYGYETLLTVLKPLVKNGLKNLLLFGVPAKMPKDSNGSSADSKDNPVIKVLPRLRQEFPGLLLFCDVSVYFQVAAYPKRALLLTSGFN